MIETLTTQVDGSAMAIHVARPKGFSGPRPAVLVMHHKGAVDEFTRDRMTKLAETGYIAAAPELFHRTPDAPADAKVTSMRDTQIVADSVATLKAVEAAMPVRAWGVLGHCMGGRMGLLAASAHPVFAACVAYYPGNMFKSWGEGPTPFDQLKSLNCPTQAFFGNDDQNPSPTDADKLDAALAQLGVRHAFHRYDGAAHAFQNFTDPDRHREAQGRDAWGKTIAFLATELKP
ncbi:MAG TPA: dienelactone hydrolase family protein [Alphaproteobacteria bacterium]|nr:dienelactone hydrolase family protein [Alphaproteobacteria bacterium]